MNLIKLNKIKLTDRARKDFGNIAELAESIRHNGLINPITIHKDGTLIAGERRLEAMRLLKWADIPVRVYEELTPLQKKEVELEENFRRKSMTWQEEAKLKSDIHELKSEQAGGKWNKEDTAEFMGVSKQEIVRDTMLHDMAKEYPELLDEKDKSNAYRKAVRIQERETRELLVSSLSDSSKIDLKIKDSSKVTKVKNVSLINASCLDVASTMKDNTVDLIITDPPYAVGLGENYDFKKSWDEVYEDDEKDILELCAKIYKESYRVLKEGSHAFIFYASRFHHEHHHMLLCAGFNVDPIPAIWNKAHGGTSFRPYTNFAPNYEPFFHVWKGVKPNKLSSPHYSVFNFDSLAAIDKRHPAEKPLGLALELIELGSIKGELVVDWFGGSGWTAEGCLVSERKCISTELSENHFNVGSEKLLTFQAGKNMKGVLEDDNK
jgi:ParB family chromosome partitioning protein